MNDMPAKQEQESAKEKYCDFDLYISPEGQVVS